MRRHSGVALCLTLIAISLPALAGYSGAESMSQERPRPQAVVSGPTDRNFGEVFGGEELEHIVMLQNVGKATLELSEKKLAESRPYDGARYRAVPVAFIRRGASAAPG